MYKFALIGLAFLGSVYASCQTQAAIVEFNLIGSAGPGLLPGNELHTPASAGSGGEFGDGIQFDDATNLLAIRVNWNNLNGNVTLMHLHGPASTTATAGILVDLVVGGPVIHGGVVGVAPNPVATPVFNPAANGGFFAGGVTLSAANRALLEAGNLYLNVHTTAFGAGELRGNLVAVPEPSSMALVGAALVGFGVWRRRKLQE